jgi:pyruvate,water dikinase
MAVRSSAVGEDSAEATFAGQQETYLWVRGAEAIVERVRDCWASLYSAEAIAYRANHGDAGAEPAMGVTVQLMADADVAGVMFTCNPVSGDPSVVADNATWGLGLGVVGGDVTPDEFLVSKVSGDVVRRQISRKEVEHRPAPGGGTEVVPVDDERASAPCLDDAALLALLDVAKAVQAHFGSHQDIEWALAGGELYVVQSRPVTVVAKTEGPKGASAMDLIMAQFGVPGR